MTLPAVACSSLVDWSWFGQWQVETSNIQYTGHIVVELTNFPMGASHLCSLTSSQPKHLDSLAQNSIIKAEKKLNLINSEVEPMISMPFLWPPFSIKAEQ